MKALDTFARGGTTGLALFALAAHWLLAIDAAVWPGWLLVSLVLGVGAAVRWAGMPFPESRPGARWIVISTWVVLGIAVAMIAYGAIATPPRAWDGANYWDLRARVFFDAPTLVQPFFTQPEIYVQTREYPLTQPLCVASAMHLLGENAGRALFPLLYLAMLAHFAATLRRRGVETVWVAVFSVSFGLTPMLTDSTSGSFDSGFGDAFVCFCVTSLAAGLLTRDRLLLFAASVLLVLVKPEGLFYVPLAAAAVWAFGARRELVPLVLGWGLGACTWLPLYARLTGRESPTLWIITGVALAGVAVLGSKVWLTRRRPHPAVPMAVLFALPLLGFATLAALRATIPAGDALSAYLAGTDRMLERIPEIPSIFVGHLQYMFMIRRMGLLFVLLLSLAVIPRRFTAPCPSRVLGVFLLLAWLFLFVPFRASPEADLRHHLRSSMDRLLAHWIGACWLLVALWLRPMPVASSQTEGQSPLQTPLHTAPPA